MRIKCLNYIHSCSYNEKNIIESFISNAQSLHNPALCLTPNLFSTLDPKDDPKTLHKK